MKKTIYLAGGCFWGVEKFFKLIQGVIDTEVGYANGNTANPSYEDVCTNGTGHVEAVKIIYESTKITTESLLNLYYKIIDPTSLNKQGGDIGTQYRTGIYYDNVDDAAIITLSLGKLQNKYLDREIMVELEPLNNYYAAEKYHQDYLEKNPAGYCHLTSSQYSHADDYNKKALL